LLSDTGLLKTLSGASSMECPTLSKPLISISDTAKGMHRINPNPLKQQQHFRYINGTGRVDAALNEVRIASLFEDSGIRIAKVLESASTSKLEYTCGGSKTEAD
jgi:hypothetical protein